jgi:hypothetical protein
VIHALALGLFGLISADVANDATTADHGAVALVAVALPANANRAIMEALNRLRGEATSVGFEVRFVDAATEVAPLVQLDSLSRGLRPAAVVAFAGPEDGTQAAHSLDVWFLDRASGKTSVAHFAADEVANTGDRSDVIVAVRAVDFIRARMFDTLAGRQGDASPPKRRQEVPPIPRYYVSGGIGVLSTTAGFRPSLAPQIKVGYRLTAWGRLDATALGFGTQPRMSSSAGQVSLDQRFVGASMTVLGSEWHRLRPLAEVGGGEYVVVVQGTPNAPRLGQTTTLTSPGAVISLGVAVTIVSRLVFEARAGTLWLASQSKINSDPSTNIGSLGRPTWLAGASLGASF